MNNKIRARIAICPVCNKEFRAVKEQTGRFGGKIKLTKYCSRNCWNHRGVTYYHRNCKECNNVFSTRDKRQWYCSRNCSLAIHKGNRSHLWKGGRTELMKIKRTNADWRNWRREVFKRDNYRCITCGKKGELEPHHIKSVSEFPEYIYDVENGITLCHECHKLTDSYGYKGRWKKKVNKWE